MTSNSFTPQQITQIYRQAIEQGISLDKLEKKLTKRMSRLQATHHHEKNQEKARVKQIKQRLPKSIRYGALVIPVIFLIVGAYLLVSAVWPIAQYYVQTLPTLNQNQLIAPIPPEQILDEYPSLAEVEQLGQVAGNQTGPVILDTELDYTNLANWFDAQTSSVLANTSQEEFILDIPKLNIESAIVKIGGVNLDESLIAYPGTALPGETGAPVIFGHSVLRQFYNPSLSNPKRYNSIFSYIMTLDVGESIFLTHEGAKYKYVVREKSEVKPEDTYILAQQHSARKLKLVTCVPEGTYLRRGVVTADLVTN